MTIAVLSYRSPLTLTQTLQSYAELGLDQLDDNRIIYFQEITDIDIQIANKFSWKWIGSRENVGIAEGYRRLLEEATGQIFMFLENDWKLIDPNPFEHWKEAGWLLEYGEVDLIRLRHRANPGHPLWTRQFEGKEEQGMTHLLDSVHWTDPNIKFPKLVRRWEYPGTNRPWFMASSRYANWTNNPHMSYTKFLRENVLPHIGNRDLEIDIQGWWEQQDFTVAQGNGLFTHDRIDR